MKIAVCVVRFPVVSETFIVRQVCGLLDRGHEVTLFASEQGDYAHLHPAIREYELLDRVHFSPWLSMDRWPAKFQIIHSHFGPVGLLCSQLRKLGFFEGSLLTSFYGYDASSYIRRTSPSVYADLFTNGDRFIVTNDHMRSRLIGLGCEPGKIVNLRVGVDVGTYKRAHDGEEARDGRRRILSIGRLVEKKGIAYAIQAVAKVVGHYPDLRYDIVGDGPLLERLRRLVEYHDLTRNIVMHGSATEDQLRTLYEHADLFILPSVTAPDGDEDSMPLVLQEAQAYELPVISTHHCGIPEGIVPGVSGFLAAERDIDALAVYLQLLLSDPLRCRTMGQAGRKYMWQSFHIENLNDELVGIYEGSLQTSNVSS